MNSKKFFSLVCIIITLFFSLVTSSVFGESETFSLEFVGSVSLNGGYTIDIEGNYAFVADNEGISIINITDHTNIEKITAISLPTGALGVDVEDRIVYVACYTSGLFIVDVTDISNPIILGTHSHTGMAVEVFVQDDLAFVTGYENGMTIYDVNNKSNPVELSNYFESGSIWDVVVSENIAYVANSGVGVEVVDISDPSLPIRLTTLSGTIPSTNLSLEGDLLFIGRHGSGISIYNISTPSNPIAMGVFSDSDEGEEQLGLSGNSTILCTAEGVGVGLFDITNLPTITRLAEYREAIDATHDAILGDNYIYAADGVVGFTVLEIETIPETTGSSLLILPGLALTLVVLALKKKNK